MVVWLAGFFVAPHFAPHFSEGITSFLGFLVPLDSTHSEKGIELDVRKNEVILTGIGEKPKKKMVGMARFELATSAPPVQRANQATLHPEQAAGIVVFPAWFSMKKRIPRPIVWSGGYSASFFGSGGLALTVSHR